MKQFFFLAGEEGGAQKKSHTYCPQKLSPNRVKKTYGFHKKCPQKKEGERKVSGRGASGAGQMNGRGPRGTPTPGSWTGWVVATSLMQV